MSDLRWKTETAFLSVIEDAGLYAGNRYKSRENSNVKRELPAVVVKMTPLRHAPLLGSGQSSGNERVRVDVMVQSTAAVSTDIPDPAATHADNVKSVRDSVIVDDLAAQLSEAVADFHCLGVMAAPAKEYEEDNMVFQDVLSFECAVLEADCT